LAYEVEVTSISVFKSTADLSSAASQFKLLKLVSGEVVVSAAATDVSIGVLQNKPKAGEIALIAMLNASVIGKCRAGAAITAGALLVSDADGDVITSTPTAADFVIGQALETAGAAGDIIAVLFHPYKHAIT